MSEAGALPLIAAEALNRECRCVAVDLARLHDELAREFADRGLDATLLESHSHLFSALPVFVARAQLERMAEIITAVERVVAMPAFRERVLAWGPEAAAVDPGPLGVFFGYDFHLGVAGPQLIEINTNAGGAALNLALARAQRACCEEVQAIAGTADIPVLERKLFEMFRSEWRRQRGGAPLGSIAIVDDNPRDQYLYPEFLVFQRLFAGLGVEAVIADAQALQVRDGSLYAGGRVVDLVYNRVTDFGLVEPRHSALAQAWRDGAAVVTPHPRAHALYADKRNLALLTDPALLRCWGVPESTISILVSGIPRTMRVETSGADALWAARKRLFFKPAAGYGSRGSYRGDKLTRRVFEEILSGLYVAQAMVPPGERLAGTPAVPGTLKLDFRNYVYGGEVQLVAARLYQGQTTNFRTPGGGFAPVFVPGS